MIPIKEIPKFLGGVISKNSSTILTGLAVGGIITTSILAVKATPKAIYIIENLVTQKEDDYAGNQRGLFVYSSKKEIVRATWKLYIPAVAVGAATIACVIGANGINLRRNAALASVYGITEAAFREYKAKVSDTFGSKKELTMRESISADHIKKNPPTSNEIILTGNGEVLCYESLCGRYFKSNQEKIRRVINDLNRDLRTDMFVSLNDLYYALGLKQTDLGDQVGWRFDTGDIDPNFSSALTDDDIPCLALNFNVVPKHF